ncbi:MAG: GAF domain-containing sensor histidine kinase [Actinobacteria bacterium]|nr:GAF domain-containing sensor histidine kinase [Actinomycetota bacterium]
MSLARLRWLAILIPLAVLVVLDYLRHQVFYAQMHSFPGVIVLFVVVAVGVSVFSVAIFGVIERLERQVLERNAQLSALNEIATASAENLELNELLNVALDKVLQMMEADAGVICLLDTERAELVAACYRGFSEETAQFIRRQKLGDEPIGTKAVRTRRPVVVEKLLEDPQVAEAARREGFHSAVSVPLKSEGQVVGILGVATRRERHFPPGEVALLTAIGGQLGLAVRNAVLFSRVRQRNEELAALLAVGRAAASSLDLYSMLDEALDAVLSVTSAEAAEVWLLSEGRELILERQRGAPEEAFRARVRFRVGEGLPGQAVETDSIVAVHDLVRDPRFVREEIKRAGFQTFCALPLRRGDETVGVLGVAARDPEALCSASELRLLEGIGEQVAVAIENARLHERVLDVAVLQERERISHELHDGLAQVLGYINTQALAIRKLLSSGRTGEAEREIAAIEQAARELYTDVREAILGLRASLAAEGGLLPALRTYLDRYREMTGVVAQLETDGATSGLRLSASVEIQLLRIVQEALSNVRKHARTTNARVSLMETAEGLTLTVADDGEGFDPDHPIRTGWPRFGLQTMRERAKAIGGVFEIVSEPGRGTRAIVRVPLASPVEVVDASVTGR